ncbi:MAG: DUF222 domain-containing protein [Geodermatophilaceae bacterium]
MSAEDALRCYRELCEIADTATPPDSTPPDSTPPGTAGGSGGPPARGATVDDRTADARRVDTLIDLILGAAAGQHPEAATPSVRGGARPARGPKPRCRLDVTVAWTTLAGLDDEPAYLGGYGPIDADVARELAADATWRRLLTDPATGTVQNVGTTRYTPPAAMATLVRARDQICRWYGCRQPVSRCDLDHTVPFLHGPTASWNLAGLCRGHHRLRTHTRWRADQDNDGLISWTSPTGLHATTEPRPGDLHPPRASRRSAQPSAARPSPARRGSARPSATQRRDKSGTDPPDDQAETGSALA